MRPPRKKGQGMFLESNAHSRKAGTAGSMKRHAGNLVMVDGESVSIQAIAQRLGIGDTTAGKRLKAAQKLDGPVTWAKLEGKA